MRFIVRAVLAAALTLLTAASLQAQERPDREGWREREGWRDRDRSHWRDRYRPVGGDWQSAGVVIHTPTVERRTVQVGREAGYFGRVGVQVREGAIDLIEVTVTYGNGNTQTFPVNGRLTREDRTKAFDLTGEERVVREVTVVYRGPEEASFEVLLDPYRFSRPGPRWQQLGCQRVGLFDFADAILVGNEGRFTQIKLTADGNNVRLDRIRIQYGNGSSEDVSVRAVIPAGTETLPLDLKGYRRFIQRIELYYLPNTTPGSRATVCAFGS